LKEPDKKETLYSVLLENDEKKIHDFLMRNGKKKSYCPIYFKDNFEDKNLETN